MHSIIHKRTNIDDDGYTEDGDVKDPEDNDAYKFVILKPISKTMKTW